MKSKYLLPSHLKKLGWLLFIPSVIIGIPTVFYDWNPEIFNLKVFALLDYSENGYQLMNLISNNFLNEILGITTAIGGILIAFSREPDEDELIYKMRLDALVWAIYWNYGILILSFLLFYDSNFFLAMVVNMFTPLLLFIIRFNLALVSFRKSIQDEE